MLPKLKIANFPLHQLRRKSLGAILHEHYSILKSIKMGKEFKNCQSCGMPLKRDEKGGGTNADKSISKKYCSYCYENGEFCKHKMMEGGHSRFISWLFTRGMKRLDRWKS
jgi:hypothetical protein